MTVLNLVGKTEPLLRKKLEKFNFETPPTDPIQLAKDLTETLLTHNGLVGLAANQCGLPYRVFVIKSNPVYCCYNPIIVDLGDQTNEYEEGCLTYPNLIVKINRPTNIKVRFTLPNGVTDTYKFAGLTSRIFQHELDHLNGVIFTDHISKFKLQRAIQKANKNSKTQYILRDFKNENT